MTPEEKARQMIDARLEQSGWVIQDSTHLRRHAAMGVAVREYPTSTGSVDYALFVEGTLVGVVEAKRDNMGENMSAVEPQSKRYASSVFKYVPGRPHIRFLYEATGELTYFTDCDDIRPCSRRVFSFHRPETLRILLSKKDTVRNNLKHMPALNTEGFRDCQITALENLDRSFADNRSKALIQMATGAGKTVTAITAAYRLLSYGKMRRILFLVDTKNLGMQAENAFRDYHPDGGNRAFPEIFGVYRLKSSHIPEDVQVYISTIQRMYSILRGEELDESAEEESMFEQPDAARQPVKEVAYNAKYPPEFFDCIIVDECHRSIYNIWSQVLEYFDAFLIGLTATPGSRTIAYFNQNMVSEYTREQAIIDGVNVGEDIFLIETEITKNGAHIMKQLIEHRDRQTRKRRWKELDDDIDYTPTQLDRDIVNLSQIRTVIRTFKENLFTQLFPHRSEVPKTLIFAKTDSHAEDIVRIVREEFGGDINFCKRITCKVKDAQNVLKEFQNELNPRIAVTVDMIATGTDVKPIECLIFMRDVRSAGYFEQMKGRGTRVIGKDDLQRVSPSATESKDHFVIVDAVGVTRSQKTQTRTLEHKPTVSLMELMRLAGGGNTDEDVLTSLANRISRLNQRLTPKEQKKFVETVGIPPSTLARNLLNAFSEEVIAEKAGVTLTDSDPTPQEQERMDAVQKELAEAAILPFDDPNVRDFIENLRRSHEQILDDVNLDRVLFAGFDVDQQSNADRVIQTFRDFITANQDEITALRIIYDQRYKDRPMAIEKLKSLYEKLKAKGVTVERLWDCYAIKQPEKVKRGTTAQLADLVSLIRFEMGLSKNLAPFAETVDYNFQQWVFRRNAGSVHFTDEQMEWLRLIKDHIAASLSIEPSDLGLMPFDSKGGLGRFYEVFGEQYEAVLLEMNIELVA